jgi:hypothetical protein
MLNTNRHCQGMLWRGKIVYAADAMQVQAFEKTEKKRFNTRRCSAKMPDLNMRVRAFPTKQKHLGMPAPNSRPMDRAADPVASI